MTSESCTVIAKFLFGSRMRFWAVPGNQQSVIRKSVARSQNLDRVDQIEETSLGSHSGGSS